MSKLSCEVGLNTEECEYPANLIDEGQPAIKTRCWSCGMRACKGCTRVRSWKGYGRKRICNDCAGEYQQ